MDAIVLKRSLHMTLEQDTAYEVRSVTDLINEAVAQQGLHGEER